MRPKGGRPSPADMPPAIAAGRDPQAEPQPGRRLPPAAAPPARRLPSGEAAMAARLCLSLVNTLSLSSLSPSPAAGVGQGGRRRPGQWLAGPASGRPSGRSSSSAAAATVIVVYLGSGITRTQ